MYLILHDLIKGKSFKKYFNSEFEMDKFKRKIKYSRKLIVLKDSRGVESERF